MRIQLRAEALQELKVKAVKMLFAFVVLNILTIAYAVPYRYIPKNVVTVPPNCPGGQSWINGACRDDWYRAAMILIPKWTSDIFSSKFISVTPNCPPGQKYSNGGCRDELRGGDFANSLLFNHQLESLWNDYVRKVLETRIQVEEHSNFVANKAPRRITDIPKQCPIGYGLDALGFCRPQI